MPARSNSPGFARRRAAFIEFPQVSFSEATIARIAAEGYDDVCIAIIPAEGNLGNVVSQGFTVPQARQLHDWCHRHGLGVSIFTGYMKYEEGLIAREPQRAMITFGSREQLDSDGLPGQWLCPFRPENRQRYWEQLLEPVTHWPAVREIYLNDEAFLGFASGAIGCYCDYCCARFRSEFGQDPPRRADWDDPLWQRWIEHRFENWTTVHAELRARIRQRRPDIAVGIQHSPCAPLFTWNCWKSAIDLGRDAEALDLLCTDPYHFIHLSVATLRPHRRLLTEGVRSLKGACLDDRRTGICAQGFMPPAQSFPLSRQDGLLAGIVPFALGADLVFNYTYELAKIIPGFDEGWSDTRKLLPYLERTGPDPFVTVIAPIRTEAFARPQEDWAATYLIKVMDIMYRVGLPWRWFYDHRIESAADQLRGPIIVPDAECLNERQLDMINNVARRGEGVLWIGKMPQTAGAIAEPGDFELATNDDADRPIILDSRVAPPPGRVGTTHPITKVGDAHPTPGLLLADGQAWLSGWPKYNYSRPGVHGVVQTPTGGIDLLRHLLIQLAGGRQPLVRFDPLPINDYAKIRPWDQRALHNAELLPLAGPDGILAIIFPYTPVGFDAGLLFCPPAASGGFRRLTDLWNGPDYTPELQRDPAGRFRLPIRFPGDCELMAIWAEYAHPAT